MTRLTAIGYANLMLTVIAVALVVIGLVLLTQQGEGVEPTTYTPREREPIVVQLEPTPDCAGESGLYGAMCRIDALPE